LVALLHGI